MLLPLLAEKRTYNGLPDFMTEIARDELVKLSDDIEECSVIYLPQVMSSVGHLPVAVTLLEVVYLHR